MTPPNRGDGGALVWEDERRSPRTRPVPTLRRSRRSADAAGSSARASEPPPEAAPAPETEPATDRIPLREASERYGVSVGTLRNWCRSGQIDGLLVDGPSGRRWMATPASIAERVATGRRPAAAADDAASPRPEPGAMLVPRAAWDKLMDQLGNLHEAGQELAEARERAARYETEAAFLRERLAEIRAERDELRERADRTPPTPAPAAIPDEGGFGDLLRVWRGRFGRSRSG